MAEHGLGLRPNGTAGAPVVGVERTQIGSASDVLNQGVRETDTKAAAKQQASGIPSFEDNPLGAVGLILQEFAAGVRGTEGPVAKLNAQAAEQQGLKLQRDALRLKAIQFGVDELSKADSPEAKAVIAKTIGKINPEAGEVLTALSELAVEKSQAIMSMFKLHPDAFPGAVLLAELLGTKEALKIYGKAAGKLLEQQALAPGRVEEAGATAAAQRETPEAAADRAGQIAAAKEEAKGAGESALLKGGAIKPSVTAEMRKIAGIAHGGSVIDELTGEVTGLNREQSENVVKVIAEAERLITAGKAKSAGAAVIQAVKTIGLPEVLNPEIQISTSMREQLLDQKVEVTVLRGFADDLLGDVSLGTGALSNLKAAMDATLGQVIDATFDGGVFFQDTQEAREDIRLFNQEVKRAIVNNPRFPVAEQEIVQKMLTDPNAWFKNPATAVVNFRQLIDWIDRKADVTGSLLAGKIPKAAKGGDDDALSAEVNRILGLQ